VPQKIQRYNFDFVVPSVLPERPSEVVLNVHQLCHHYPYSRGSQQQQPQEEPAIVHRHVLSVATDVLTYSGSGTMRLFPDMSALGGASPGHFYADTSKRALRIQLQGTFLETGWEILEWLVPLRALMDPEQSSLSYCSVSVVYEPYLGWEFACASRAGEATGSVPAAKLPLALRDVGADRLWFAIRCGALIVFEVRRDLGIFQERGN